MCKKKIKFKEGEKIWELESQVWIANIWEDFKQMQKAFVLKTKETCQGSVGQTTVKYSNKKNSGIQWLAE